MELGDVAVDEGVPARQRCPWDSVQTCALETLSVEEVVEAAVIRGVAASPPPSF